MKLIAYKINKDQPFEIRPSSLKRGWMEHTNGHAYRCLPLNIANCYGWDILTTERIVTQWNGGNELKDIGILSSSNYVASHFGFGILTFSMNALFETEEGYNLYVQGPVNNPKDGIYPLTGIVETDWAPFTFTMNYKFTRPFTNVVFEENEPICTVFPIKRQEIEEFEPRLMLLEENEEKSKQYYQWSKERDDFNSRLHSGDEDAIKEKWQKRYFHGNDMSDKKFERHETKIKLKEFNNGQ